MTLKYYYEIHLVKITSLIHTRDFALYDWLQVDTIRVCIAADSGVFCRSDHGLKCGVSSQYISMALWYTHNGSIYHPAVQDLSTRLGTSEESSQEGYLPGDVTFTHMTETKVHRTEYSTCQSSCGER